MFYIFVEHLKFIFSTKIFFIRNSFVYLHSKTFITMEKDSEIVNQEEENRNTDANLEADYLDFVYQQEQTLQSEEAELRRQTAMEQEDTPEYPFK